MPMPTPQIMGLNGTFLGLPWCPVVKTQPANAGVVGSVPGQGTEISHAERYGQKLKINMGLPWWLRW